MKGKSREEVSLKKFKGVEIISAITGVNVIITRKTIAKLLISPNSGRFIMGTKDNSPKADAKWYLFDSVENLCSSNFGKVKNMKKDFRLLFKILIGC